MRVFIEDIGWKQRKTNIPREPNKATTPESFPGAERRMAYANRKYHSGTMCFGVTIGLAGMKLSGSKNKVGLKKIR